MKLNVELENCYGINLLVKEFDLTKSDSNAGVNSLYAPNGTLKTSLAKTFKNIENGKETKDQIFPDRISVRNVKINGADIESSQVLVIDSYNESYSSKQLSTLLVHEELKQQYDTALKEVDDKRTSLIKALSKSSGKQSKGIPELICDAFRRPQKEFLDLLTELSKQEQQDFIYLNQFKYGDLFNQKVMELIASEDFGQDLTEYVTTYDKLIEESPVLSRTFNHQRANDVSKSLGDSGFFNASHSVNLSIDGAKQEITSKEQLNQLLKDEQDKIIQDPQLKDKFLKVDAQLKNKDTQAFRDFIAANKNLLPEYQDISQFKQKVIFGYLQSEIQIWTDLVETYEQNQILIAGIVQQAQQQKTTWETVVETFNKRFSVPFKLSVENQEEVILHDIAPSIKFEFDDGRGTSEHVKQENLIEVLSQGEKRALYILNVLFEIEVQKNRTSPILIIIDDIADSFDYKNKYAIVEYLGEIAKHPKFHLLLLTHNFDFHRIIGSRIGVNRQNRLMAIKSPISIIIKQEKYQKDVFNFWKENLSSNDMFRLASIPFARNIADYCGHQDYYSKLTSLLHFKPDSRDIKVCDLQAIYRDLFRDQADLQLPNGSEIVIDQIIAKSYELLSQQNESPELESKIILAMGIRIKAEEFMINKIAQPDFVSSITKEQTRALFNKFIDLFPQEEAALGLLDQVNLMTPENIHLNSFMYEPILDMSAHSLYSLYSNILALISTASD